MNKYSAARILLAVVVVQLLNTAPAPSHASARLTLADLHQYTPQAAAGNGDWLSFDMEPATLKPTYKKKIKLLNLTVIGDYEQLEWQTAPGLPIRTFARDHSTTVDGLLLSVFDVKFPAKELRGFGPLPIRFDAYHADAAFPFRMRPSTLPKTKVVRINDHVQYSSHVVNISVPATWDEFVPAGDRLADVQQAALIFYEHFEDAYEDLSFIMTRAHRQPVGGRLAIVLDVQGTNTPNWNGRADWGGSSILMGANVHVRGDFLWNAHTIHETGHQWGFWFDLFDLAGAEPLGPTECLSGPGHAPLVAESHTFLKDTCLGSSGRDRALCIKKDENEDWALAQCDVPLSYHPFQLYAMGLLDPADVPPLVFPQRQAMPQPHRSGTRVDGPFLEVTIDDVIARYGARQGPATPTVWRRAHIVVSPDHLLPAKDLAWFNFFAKRVSDPEVTGIEGMDLAPSMEVATRGMVDLQTEIHPRSQPQIDGPFAVSYPKLGKKDFVGVKLDRPFETHYAIGETHRISGTILEPGESRKIAISIGSQTFRTRIKAGGRFTLRLKPKHRNRGPQLMILALANPKVPLGYAAPVYVE